MVKVLGIDPAINSCGYAVVSFHEKKINLIEGGVIDGSKLKTNSKKLANLFSKLEKIIIKYQLNCVAIEKMFASVNLKATISQAQAFGVCACLVENHKLKLVEYDNKTVKKAITGYGNANKEQIRQILNYEIGDKNKLDKFNHDTIDALAIAYCHLLTIR